MPRGIFPHIPDHRLLRRIGEGSYGEVWLARNIMGSFRAVKVVYREQFDSDRPYEREFGGIQKFEPLSRSHEGFVDLLQVGRDDQAGYFYCVMELADPAGPATSPETGVWDTEAVQGVRPDPPPSPALDPEGYRPKTLAGELERSCRLPIEDCLRLGLNLSDALGHLHRAGLVHRDVKPSNVIFVNGVAKLADIGLVASVSAAKSFVGTEGYIPPEGPGTAQADLYSLGKVLYECATGKDRNDFPELPTGFTPDTERPALLELNEVLLKACQNEPGRRYRAATELHADLLLLQAGRSVRHLRRVERRVAILTRVGVGLGVAAFLAAAAYLVQARQARLLGRLAEAQTRARTQTEENLYLHQVRAAQTHWEAGDPRQADRLLEACPEAFRAWEWQYLKRRCQPRGEVLRGQSNEVWSLAVSPDGRWLASSDKDGRVSLWDLPGSRSHPAQTWPAQTEAEPFDFIPDPGVLTFSHDGRRLACLQPTRGKGWTLGLASLGGTNALRELIGAGDANQRPLCLGFSPDDRILMMGHADGVVRCYDIVSGRPVASYPILAAAFSPDGASVASMGVAKLNWPEEPQPARELRIYETATGREIFASRNLLEAPALLSLAFSPDGQRVAAGFVEMRSFSEKSQTRTRIGAARGRVIVWDLASSSEVLRQDLAKQGPTDLKFSPDGRRLAIACAGLGWLVPTTEADVRAVHLPNPGEVVICDVLSGQEVATLRGHAHDVTSLAYLPAGRALASGSSDRTIRLWELDAPNVIPLGGLPANPVSRLPDPPLLSPDGRMIAVRTLDWTLDVLDPVTGQLLASQSPPEDERNEETVFATAPAGLLGLSDVALRFWDLAARRATWSLTTTNLGFAARRVACSPDGQRVALASAPDLERGDVVLLEAASGRQLLRTNVAGIGSFGFSPDSHLFALGDGEGRVRVWSANKGNGVFTTKATGSSSGTALTDLSPEVGQRERPGLSKEVPVTALAFSPDGRQLVTAVGTLTSELRLLDLPTRQPQWMGSVPSAVRTVTFSPDGRRLAMATGRFPGSPADLLIYDTASGQQLLHLGADVERVAFSPDGARLWAVNSKRTLLFWDAPRWPAPATPPAVALKPSLVEGLDQRIEARLAMVTVFRHVDPSFNARLLFLPGAPRLAAAYDDGTVRVLRLPGGEVEATLGGLEGAIESLAVGGTNSSLFVGTSAGGLYRWDGTAAPAARIPTSDAWPIAALALAPDGSRAAWARGHFAAARGLLLPDAVGTLIAVPTGRSLGTCRVEGRMNFQALSFAGDGRTLAVLQDRTVSLLDGGSGRVLRELTPGFSPLAALLDRDGRRCVVGCAPSRIEVLDTGGGGSVLWLKGNENWVVSLALSPGDTLLASGAADGTARIWELATGQEVSRFRFPRAGSAIVRSVSFSTDGRWLAAGAAGEMAVLEVPTEPGGAAPESATP
jgi:WD40 repeat protein